MKVLMIAWKDLTRSFRTASMLVFMFGVPLLVGGMFYLMFGSMAGKDGPAFGLPQTRVAVANLDQGSPALAAALGANSLGDFLLGSLQGKDFSALMEISTTDDPARARALVDQGQAGVALIIPADFSEAYADGQRTAVLEFYQDPGQVLGPAIVKSILSRYLEGFSGVRIAMAVTRAEGGDDAAAASAAKTYTASLQSAESTELVHVRSLGAAQPAAPNFLAQIVGPILSGMMIFFAFFTGGTSAQSIVREQEEGTLARLFSTPTRQSTILWGKFLAVGLTVLVQVSLLLAVSHLLFGIEWGRFEAVAMTAVAIVLAATGFGILITSLVKTMRQSGMVYGGLVTATGMLGMMSIFSGSIPGGQSAGSLVPLLVPQGWAVRGLLLAMSGAGMGETALNALALLGWAVVLFTLGALRFQKRFG